MAHLDREVITAYIDAELPPDEMAAVEAHLASCETCRAEFGDLRAVAALVRQLPVYRPRREIEIDDRDKSGSGTMARIVEFSKPLALAAVILLIAFAGLRFIGTIGGNDDNGNEEGPLSAVQQAPADGTESAGEASRTITAGESAPAAAGAPPESNSASSADTIQEAAPEYSATAPIAPTAAASPREVAEDDGPSLAMIAAVTLAVVAIAGSAAWYTLRRSPRRRRS
jgi:hypothetical protein